MNVHSLSNEASFLEQGTTPGLAAFSVPAIKADVCCSRKAAFIISFPWDDASPTTLNLPGGRVELPTKGL